MFGKITVGRFLVYGLFFIFSFALFVSIHDEPPFQEPFSANSSVVLTKKTKSPINAIETTDTPEALYKQRNYLIKSTCNKYALSSNNTNLNTWLPP